MRRKNVILMGGIERPQEYARIVASSEVNIRAFIFGSDTPKEIAEEAAASTGGEIGIYFENRPDRSPEIMGLFDQDGVDLLISCFYDYKLHAPFLTGSTMGAINLHPAALPENRGLHSPFWGIMDETVHGATLHWMSTELDTGDIIDQITFDDDGVSSAEAVRDRARDLCLELFERNLPAILEGSAARTLQPEGGRYHFGKEIAPASSFDWDQSITMGHLVKLARATDCFEHGFFVTKHGRRYRVHARVSLAD